MPGQKTGKYTKCAKCDHFVESNDEYFITAQGIAKYIHLDNGEKEHDHDASPSSMTYYLEWWQYHFPALFTTYPDEMTGPNSEYYKGDIQARTD